MNMIWPLVRMGFELQTSSGEKLPLTVYLSRRPVPDSCQLEKDGFGDRDKISTAM
jgi:hypothetical protein